MISTREQGFTLIELLVVAIVVGILGTLVAMTYSGVQSKNRNSHRESSIDALQSQMEIYYAENTRYPSITQLNDTGWRPKNLKDFNAGDMRDPQWSKKIVACTANNQPVFAASPTAKCYSYQATTSDGSPCNDPATACAQYSLTAVFEGGEKYVKTSLN
jgi:prepilin-type N-terminal cleavage/methylation domain-containing protein